jgi:hypothetical protein
MMTRAGPTTTIPPLVPASGKSQLILLERVAGPLLLPPADVLPCLRLPMWTCSNDLPSVASCVHLGGCACGSVECCLLCANGMLLQ